MSDLEDITEAVNRRCSIKKVFLKILQNSKENNFSGVSFFFRLAIFSKKRLLQMCFSANLTSHGTLHHFYPMDILKCFHYLFSALLFLYLFFLNIFSIDFAWGNPILLILWFINFQNSIFIEHLQWLLLIIVTTWQGRHYYIWIHEKLKLFMNCRGERISLKLRKIG